MWQSLARGYWSNIKDSDWYNWKWHLQNSLKDYQSLKKIFPLSLDEKQACKNTIAYFRMSITPYYACLINFKDDNCPIRKQAIPSTAELKNFYYETIDPLLEDSSMPIPGLIHRYPDRVLIYTNHMCSVYCRHCTRRRNVSKPETSPGYNGLTAIISYIKTHTELRDVILSGGDPLSLGDNYILDILSKLRAIPHVEIIRIGTRYPVTLPYRITEGLANQLKNYNPLYIQVHFNHPMECTKDALLACEKLADAGCVLVNQMVLLKGINDSADIVKVLNQKLLQMRVQPYYIYHCDAVVGVGHFRTSIRVGMDIINSLEGWTSGLAIPHYVVDLPNGGGKVRLSSDRIEETPSTFLIRNYQGKQFVLNK